ncbi:MAG: GTPase HflX [Gammaproteobacteria bacterium]|nr:MAG: GTPase HflX [Gammaproteobacteria bacterium]
MFDRHEGGENAVLVHVDFAVQARGDNREELEEFIELVTSAGITILDMVTTKRQAPHAKFYLGKGKMEDLCDAVKVHQADVVLFNHTLTPAQERNIEEVCQCRVVDRIGLILDIFAQRASTYEGKLQVELAQLKHMSTRLIRGWTHLERQKGGIGLRGPGETQLETDRRLLRGRIKSIENRLDKVSRQRNQGRRSRSRAEVPTVSLVGYTNAGKSTLFNQITGANVLAADKLFATLDPTLRRVEVAKGQPIILADTVGFIRHLPHDLVAAFRATLEETREADLLLHVIDFADPTWQEKEKAVQQVLNEIGAEKVAILKVMNKVDLLGDIESGILRDEHQEIQEVRVSAKSELGVEQLLEAISELLAGDRIDCSITIPPEHGKLRGLLFQLHAIREESYLDDGSLQLSINLSLVDWMRLKQKLHLDLDQFIDSK